MCTAAVAAAQYQKAVVKARISTMVSLAKSMVDAQEMYYLANNHYADSLEDLDIEMPNECRRFTCASYECYSCNNFFQIANGTPSGDDSIIVRYCPGVALNNSLCASNKTDVELQFRLQHFSIYPEQAGTRICASLNGSSLGKSICAKLIF